jgi:predicted RNA binding protein YcfA (HicA-like mRNA interferase family)
MLRTPRVSAADTLRALRRAGWQVERQRGSHVLLRHPERPAGRVVVPVHAGRILKPKTLASILDQAELTVDDLVRLL